MENFKLWINGEWVDAADGKTFESISPGTGKPGRPWLLDGRPTPSAP